MNTKRMQKGHSGRPKLSVLSAAPIIDKTVENMRKQNEKKTDKGIVCSRDAKLMKLGE